MKKQKWPLLRRMTRGKVSLAMTIGRPQSLQRQRRRPFERFTHNIVAYLPKITP